MLHKLLILLALVAPVSAQTVRHYPAEETNNTYSGTNTYNGDVNFAAHVGCAGVNGTSGQVLSSTGAGCQWIANPGSITNQATGVIPLATGVTSLGAQSHLDDGVSTAGTITSTEPFLSPVANHIVEASQYASFALALAAVPSGGRLHLGAGYSVTISSQVTISVPMTIQCDPGATLIHAASLTSTEPINVTAANVKFDGCTLNENNVPIGAGIAFIGLQSTASNFTFENGELINSASYGIRDNGASDFAFLYNYVNASAQFLEIFSPSIGTASNFMVVGNHGVGGAAIQSNVNSTALTGVIFSNNILTPPVNGTILTIQDASPGRSAPVTNGTISGNTCIVQAATAGAAPFGCYSLVSPDTSGFTMTNNVEKAQGQYVAAYLNEFGWTNSTINGLNVIAGNDPGLQSYNVIQDYQGGNSYSNISINGWSANGVAVDVLAQGNADNLSFSHIDIQADSSASATSAMGFLATASVAYSGNIRGLKVSGLNVNKYGGSLIKAAVDITDNANFGLSTTGGTGSGLTVNIVTSTTGAVQAVQIATACSACTYVTGDTVAITQGANSTATATVTASGGTPTALVIAGGGSGYYGALSGSLDDLDLANASSGVILSNVGSMTVGRLNAASSVTSPLVLANNTQTPTAASFPAGVAPGLASSASAVCPNGVNGVLTTAGCTIAAPAGSLTGSTLAANVTASSLTSFGNTPTLNNPTLSNQVIGAYGVTATASNKMLQQYFFSGSSGAPVAGNFQMSFQGASANSTAFIVAVQGVATQNASGFSLTSEAGGYFKAGQGNSGSGYAVTNAYDIYAASPGTGLTGITNSYGLYLSDMNDGAANHWGLFQAGTTDMNYFAGYTEEDNWKLIKEGSVIASAATIAPTQRVFHVSGTAAISTITPPSVCILSGYTCQITIIPDGTFTTSTAGNIALASTAVVSKALSMTYDATAAKWYPSY